jgi:hypothetical protein
MRTLFICLIGVFTMIIASSAHAKPYDGTWHSKDKLGFVAKIKNNKIKITMNVDKRTRALYWQGTFSNGNPIISKGDTKVLESAFFGSSDSSKKFTYADGVLIFKFSMMDMTKVVFLHRD